LSSHKGYQQLSVARPFSVGENRRLSRALAAGILERAGEYAAAIDVTVTDSFGKRYGTALVTFMIPSVLNVRPLGPALGDSTARG
jgi:hypothetical protein